MPSFRTVRAVPHSADAMFDLVADVDSYPAFVPLCERLDVRARSERPDGSEVLVADMTAAYGLFRETFTTKVTLERPKREILVEYIDGPFRHLRNEWRFADTGEDASDVHFYIEYEFKSRTLGALVGGMFDRAFRKFTEAFERRADAVYRGV